MTRVRRLWRKTAAYLSVGLACAALTILSGWCGFPHCAEHVNGASLDSFNGRARLRFRSYTYQRAFRALNG
jgi:hypothetical protein